MSEDARRFPPTRQTLRTRVLMVGVFVGAILALSFSWAFSWDIDGANGAGGGASPEQAAQFKAREKAFRSPAGSCLDWTKPDAADAHLVPCDQRHLFEVAGVVDLAKEFRPGAPAPDVEGWRRITEERCGEVAETYLDKPLDPFGKLTLGVLHPDEQQWADGDRKLRCGLQWAGPGGELQPLTVPAADVNQSDVWEPGTCLGLAGKTVGDPVDCAEEHSYEIIGQLDLAKEFDEYPSLEDQKAWLDKECSRVAEEYTGGAELPKRLILSWDLREPESWEAGSTLVNCKIGAKLPDESGLAPVRGSVHKDAKAEEPTGEKGPGKPEDPEDPEAPEDKESQEPGAAESEAPGQETASGGPESAEDG
ncbi:septum formation family protein [Qaidamihabitans albus]|uniref:septum formation family protein n=1 Tax=Qaidamihabitans albus TaxID=2795733 RepID=UPI001F2F0993|nr:septum formation family protein [Qaidamihabitans albus]